MGKIDFKFSTNARTVNLLGKDNVVDYRSAISELIKNSYDAKAQLVKLVINENSIIIVDNGKGMSVEKIADVYFNLGTSDKLNIAAGSGDRIMNGSMGIGRLSLGRLGKKSQIITSDGLECTDFSIDWSSFDIDKQLEELSFEGESITLDKFSILFEKYTGLVNVKTGTIIITTSLTDDWNSDPRSEMYTKVETSLRKIKNPMKNKEDDIFDVQFKYFDEETISIIVNDDEIYSDATMNFRFNSKNSTLYIEGYFDEIDYEKLPLEFFELYGEELSKLFLYEKMIIDKNFYFYKEIKTSNNTVLKKRDMDIGDISGKLFFNKKQNRGNYSFIKPVNARERREEIEEGIALYRDSFRIRPYGDLDSPVGFDWIGIEKTVRANPAGVGRSTYVMSSSQLSGYVSISRKDNTVFLDQANREGIISSVEFETLQSLMLQVVKEFSKIRSSIHILYIKYMRRKTNFEFHLEQGEVTTKKIDQIIQSYDGDKEKIIKSKKFKDILANEDVIFDLHSLAIQEKERSEELIKETDMLRVLATQGITMSIFAHQVKNDKHFFKNSPKSLAELGKYLENKYHLDFSLEEKKYDLYNLSKVLEEKNESIISFINSAVKNPTPKKKEEINIIDFLEKLISWWDVSIIDRFNSKEFFINNKLYTEEHKNKYIVNLSTQQMESIILNLLANSYKAFRRGNISEQKIWFYVNVEDDNLIINYIDNGGGLSKEIGNDKNIIFKPYESYPLKEKSTGMGLWIVSSIMHSLKGEVQLNSNVGDNEFDITLVFKGVYNGKKI